MVWGLPLQYEHTLLTHQSKTCVHYQVASTALQTVEFFHLVFLRGLVARGEDKSLVALKGGCNLRFFFSSIRYSEDIDLDVVVMSKATLKNKVDRLLASPLVKAPLLSRGIRVVDVSTPKQTDTTQRWKVGLEVAGSAVPVRTKVEFSRRDEIEGAAFEAVSPEVLAPYSLTPMLATHYRVQRAISQKVEALAGRPEPQARDVFDLNLLLARTDAREITLPTGRKREEAIENAMSISFDHYAAQVVAYLDPDQAPAWDGKVHWEAMQDAVVSRLERAS
jgi:predicted nucleotidyltransferase component of viral defense system